MIEIIPAIIPQSLEDLRSTLDTMHHLAPLVQIDITDGMFVLSQSWPMRPQDKKSFEALVRKKETLPFSDEFKFEIDIMAHSPEKIIAAWVPLGIARAVFHLKSKHDFSEIKRAGGDALELGVAIDRDPPYEKLATYIPHVDYVQVMGIATLGRQGEPFDPRALTVIERVQSDFPNVTIQVDGGVNDRSAPHLIAAGATRLIAGSYIVKSEDPKGAIETLKNIEPCTQV